LGRKFQVERDGLHLIGIVAEFVITGEANLVGAVPEKTLLAVIEIQADIHLRGIQRQSDIVLLLLPMHHSFASCFIARVRDQFSLLVTSGGWTLLLWTAPGRRDTPLQFLITGIGARNDG
jgi:hypothetical protein